MSGDKRSVSTDALETLGTIIDENAGRDAIHIAVEPCRAGMTLFPGEDIGLNGSGIAYSPRNSAFPSEDVPTGIVDPFLKGPVHEGQWFWFLVYPRTITSLRHVWSHPAFGDIPEPQAASGPSREASEEWLREWQASSEFDSFEQMEAVVRTGKWGSGEYGDSVSNQGENIHFYGNDASGDIPAEFWVHAEIAFGIRIPQDERASYFSCSC